MTKSIIGLVNPKNPVNVGAILRNAGCFRVNAIYYTGQRYTVAARYQKGHSRLCHADTHKAQDTISLTPTENLLSSVDAQTRIVCVELAEGAIALPEYQHAQQAMYVFGPEDGSIPQNTINQADDVIYIPTMGCLNLAATVSITLYDRMVKLGLHEKLGQLSGDALIRNSRDRNNRLRVNTLANE